MPARYTLPSEEGRLCDVFTAVEDDDVVPTELVPLEGEEGGEVTFLGSICSQYSSGNLDPSERRRKVRKLKSKPLCQQEPSMLNTQELMPTLPL